MYTFLKTALTMRISRLMFIALIVQTFGNDSLETALKAVTNRERIYQGDFLQEPYDDSPYFLPQNKPEHPNKNFNIESSLIDYLRNADSSDREEVYQKSSPFRERLKQDPVRVYNRNTYDLDDDDVNEQYYQHPSHDAPLYSSKETEVTNPDNYNMKKRSYYPSMSWESVGMKKRSRAFQPDGPRESLYLLNYAPRDEIFNRLQEDEEDSSDDIDYQLPVYNQKKWHTARTIKRFPVSKRSSSSKPIHNSHQYKRSSSVDTSAKTDPKAEKDLADIFDPKGTTQNPKAKSATETTKHTKVINPKTKTAKMMTGTTNKSRAAVVSSVTPQSDTLAINTSKKSIDWSDYFGLDRRKKSAESLNSDWLMDRYYKSVMQPKPLIATTTTHHGNAEAYEDDKKLDEMDNKLHNIEESLIDDTLKFTGAHEGASDPQETRYVKDRVISRLAAAYSLEKMRRALGEYRRTLAQTHHNNVKRTSIGRKAAIDPTNNQQHDGLEDNKIKCLNDNDCSQSDRMKFGLESDVCLHIEALCDHISTGFGHHVKSVEDLCQVHQVCLLCSDNNWFGPLRQCDVLYLSKLNEICGEDTVCRENVGDVLNLSKLSVSQTADCALMCPESI